MMYQKIIPKSLKIGSHKLPMLVKPTKWSNDSFWYKNNNKLYGHAKYR